MGGGVGSCLYIWGLLVLCSGMKESGKPKSLETTDLNERIKKNPNSVLIIGF